MIGQTIAHYKVTAKLGAGGMGEVYRATDAKLGRDVALKVLPESFAADAQRMARFQREAHVLASLNHPNIATIHGLEESGGIHALVLELVEGPTLAERIAQGPIPTEDARPVARQIAEALEYAHERGVIHRDLKPANIKLTTDGQVKVLDFGLAKALEEAPAASDIANSPTLSLAATRAGIILGTAAYMCPEQARGSVVDKRADIWAFGVVLWEMLTGHRLFDEATASDTLAAVLRAEVNLDRLPQGTPRAIRLLLGRCIEREPKRRLRDIGEARILLESPTEPEPGAAFASQPAHGLGRGSWWLALAALLLGAFLGVIAMSTRQGSPPTFAERAPHLQSTIELPSAAPLGLGSNVPLMGYDSPALALSPDGSYLAYVAKSGSGTMLYLREMASGEVRPVPGTEGALHSFFSPDSRWLGFLTNDRVKKVPIRGGSAVTLCEARSPVLGWWPQQSLVYFTEDESQRITRVPADGGKPEPILSGPRIGVNFFSDVLPDGKSALAIIGGGIGGDHADIVLVDSETLATKLLVRSGYGARYVPPGYLVFARAGNLLAVPFDLDRKETSGEPTLVAAGAGMESLFMQVHASFSHNGLLAFAPAGDLSVGKLAWVDRRGKAEYLDVPARVYGALDLAPDGKKLAVHVADVQDYVWVYDQARREGRRLPSLEAAGWPLWSPDGRRMVVHDRAANRLTVKRVDEQAEADQKVDFVGIASSWSAASDVLAAWVFGSRQVVFLAPGKSEVIPGFDGWFPAFSPDGRWIAYSSNRKTGAEEIFLRSYPDGKVDRQVSVHGGIEPLWSPSGELFFRNGNRWFSTRVSTDPELRWDPPRLVFDTDFIDTPGRSYDVSPDGQRLLVVKRAEPPAVQSKIRLMVNWVEALRRP